MSSDTQRITVRIPNQMVDDLQKLVDKDEYSNMSEAIRTAIREFIKNQNAPDHISKVTVDLPKKKVNEIKDLVEEGDSISVDDAIRTAVREYVKNKIKQYKKSLEE
ncbi:MAG: ribbon-helix-helix domain-containing protein [Thermoplasmatota archaeon]